MKQIELLKKENSAYGGELLKTREGRSKARPLDTKNTMHLVLRSSQANGKWSFKREKHKNRILKIIYKFSSKYGIKILAFANVGNHLHLHIKLSNRYTYAPFIRATTASIAMAITGTSRWCQNSEKFWDYRPFTRAVKGLKAVLRLKDYLKINELEGFGYTKNQARFLVAWDNYSCKYTKSETG